MTGVSRGIDRIEAIFDDPHLVANAGLVVPATLMVRLGLEGLINRSVRLVGPRGGYRPGPRTVIPQETDKPRIDVTRAPMSVAPEPRTPPKTAAPGGNSGNGGGWPW